MWKRQQVSAVRGLQKGEMKECDLREYSQDMDGVSYSRDIGNIGRGYCQDMDDIGIILQVRTAEGQDFHTECFSCQRCGIQLGGKV